MSVTCLNLLIKLFGPCRELPPSGIKYFCNDRILFNYATDEMMIDGTLVDMNEFVGVIERKKQNGGGNLREIGAQFIAERKACRSDEADEEPNPSVECFEPICIISDSQLPEIELTRFTKHGGPLTKRISLAPDGSLVKDDSACMMTYGMAERVKVTGINALGKLIEDLKPSQAIALGTLQTDLPNRVGITTKDKLVVNGVAQPNIIARTGANIIYRGPAFALLDYDSKGIPTAVAAEVKRAGGFWGALLTVLPVLKNTARVTRHSTSAGLSRIDTGEALPGSDGVHVYLAAKDGADCERFLRALHDRCWLAGLGWYVVSASGALLERSIVDRMVGGAERLVFEGGPVLAPSLQQDKESRQPIAVDGVMLDTVAVCPPLSIVEHSRLDELKAKEFERLAPEMAKAREAFVEAQARKLVARTGMAEEAAQLVILRQCDGVLRPDVVLSFDEEALGECPVGDVLANPELYQGETLADPLEGVAYGRCVAKVMRRADGTPWIHSFAHGRTIYELKLDASAVRKAMEKAEKDDVVVTFARLAAGADLDAVELEMLRQLAKELSGIGLRVIATALKSAQQQKTEQDAKAARERAAVQRQDPRPLIRAPRSDEPFQPQMDVLNEVIGGVIAAQPPSRDIDGDMVSVRKLPVANMHAFSQAEVNIEPGEARSDKLPPPEQWVICKMSEMEVAEMIERYIDYFVEDKNGNRRSVHLATQFVQHFMRRYDDKLPTVVAIATLPIVLADGYLLAPEGLDRKRGIQFIIPNELRTAVPQPADCTEDKVTAAMKFLCDEWLVDVATDYIGKAIIIADALTLIQRSLLPDRPCFFITAGRRGGGKTTTIRMLIRAVTSLEPAAAAWSTNEEERRKTLLSYFLSGVAYIVWDNIPRGTQISCPHIEKSCTSEYYSDRKLGVSETVRTAASTIHQFTGNNIGARGDLASRSLHLRLDVDRVDPENRPFKHPDPISWTENHRAKILSALYTILLGNPQLKTPRNAEAKTRFKMWWRLIGSALEHAAKLLDQELAQDTWQELDFQTLFLTQEEDDEESATLADVLQILKKRWPIKFQATDVAVMLNSQSSLPET
jgi:hypothetical protein